MSLEHSCAEAGQAQSSRVLGSPQQLQAREAQRPLAWRQAAIHRQQAHSLGKVARSLMVRPVSRRSFGSHPLAARLSGWTVTRSFLRQACKKTLAATAHVMGVPGGWAALASVFASLLPGMPTWEGSQ